jgi:hypothetical protein
MPTIYKRECYNGREIANKLGMSHDNLYRKGTLEKLYAQGMPRSATLGRIRVPMPAFDAWFNRDNPLWPRQAAANDRIASPPLAHQPDEKQREFLHRAYSR